MTDLWTCPKCQAQFVTPNQWHSCERVSLDAHFLGRPDWQVLLFDDVLSHLERLGQFHVRAVKSAIIFKRKSSFASVKLQKSAFLLEWMAPELIEGDDRVVKTLRVSKNRIAHVARLNEADEIDSTLKQYLTEAYQLVG